MIWDLIEKPDTSMAAQVHTSLSIFYLITYLSILLAALLFKYVYIKISFHQSICLSIISSIYPTFCPCTLLVYIYQCYWFYFYPSTSTFLSLFMLFTTCSFICQPICLYNFLCPLSIYLSIYLFFSIISVLLIYLSIYLSNFSSFISVLLLAVYLY